MIACDNISFFIYTQAAVSIAIEGKTNIQTVLYHELLQTLDMSRTSVVVDVQAVRLVINDVGISAQCILYYASFVALNGHTLMH